MRILEWRYFPGPNVHCHRPVLESLLDLQSLHGQTTKDRPGFNRALLGLLPAVADHTCGLGRRGGFRIRLEEGTYFGHVAEHVALELLHRSGHGVRYGKTRQVKESTYLVVFEAPLAELGLLALQSALRIVDQLAEDPQRDLQKELEAFSRAAVPLSLGPSTEAIVRAARRRNIPVRRIGSGSVVQLGYGVHTRRIEATIACTTAATGVDIASDKALTKTILAMAGIPVPKGAVARSRTEAWAVAKQLSFPIVLKPVSGNQGRGVVTGVRSLRELREAYMMVAAHGQPVLVEEEVPGRQYRLLVVGDRVVAAAEREPASVVGDGLHTVAELVAEENRNVLRGEEHERPLTRIPLDPLAVRHLHKQGLSLHSVPRPGRRVTLRDSANLSTGGVATDVTDQVGPALQSLAVRAARAVGLDIAGVDVLAGSPAGEGAVVLEVNASPGIRMHEHPWRGRPRPVGEAIVRHLFPQGDGRIPIVAVTGTNGKSTTVRLIAHALRRQGRFVGMTTTDGVRLGDEWVVEGDCAGPRSAEVVLFDPRVEAAVLECARGGICRGGLAYDAADVGVFLNLTGDHLGQDGIDSLEDLWHVKSLVVEAVRPEGYAVLNADDPWVMAARSRVRSRVILFSQSPSRPVIEDWLAAGGRAVVLREGHIVLLPEGETVVAVRDLPFTFGGLADCMVENALAATAAMVALGLSSGTVAESLLSFRGGVEENPGRLNVHRIGAVTVLIDYGHNPAALEAVLSVARRLGGRRLVGVVGMPGDRRDEDAIRFGEIAGRGFDHVIVKEDQDLRGRSPGEMAERIVEGVLRGARAAVEVQRDESKAVTRALEIAQDGDLVVVLYEKLAPLLEVLRAFEAWRGQGETARVRLG